MYTNSHESIGKVLPKSHPPNLSRKRFGILEIGETYAQ